MNSMKGLELARAYYEAYGKPMIEKEFAEYAGRIAVGLAGEGSECFGFDDELSRDHDFEAGFCLWLTPEDGEAIGFRLFRAYGRLPEEFQGVKKEKTSLFGGRRKGVMEISEFYGNMIGCPGVPEEAEQWLAIPEYALAQAVNGEVFRDDLGEFSRIRNILQKGYPEDVRLKKIAARAALMAQSGQYNYGRCRKRGEAGAAALAAAEFVKAGISMVFLLNNRYTPYYKWMLRAMGELPLLGDLRPSMEQLLTGGGDCSGLIEEICGRVVRELQRQGLTGGNWEYLEPHALAVTETIRDGELRNLHLMEG